MSIEKEMLGAAIKRVRLARGLTQVQLAEAAGLSKGGNSIALIEQGRRFVSVDTLNALADALEVPAACLAILGSEKIGTNKAATEFMQSLQKVIRAVIDAQEATDHGSTKKRAKTMRTKARLVGNER
ncbi:MAG TPA: helix-turn-helix transcriptional regulator [Pirellulales bacterium]|jgi:transcriptional regulator with XRE-family HTH domain|nr:helix-turn-helix transcriptional regulator [Pirellulales bacterium]